MVLLIYLDTKSSRADYIFRHIFHNILGLEIQFSFDKHVFNNYKGPKINYSKKAFSNELFFYASDLLFEKNIEHKYIDMSKYKGIDVFFLCSEGILPFDPFAASFYMLSRYEEYLSSKKDNLGRFSVEDSLSFKHQFITKPVVDHWIIFIQNILISHFPNMVFLKRSFSFINTIDIDNAYAYLNKGFIRTFGKVVKDLITLNFQHNLSRMKVLLGLEKDPYDTYDSILNLHQKYNLNTIFFFLIGDYGRYDRSINYLKTDFQKLIKTLSASFQIGLHTSFRSIKENRQVGVELNRLQGILNNNVIINRQHFLLLNIPHNYRNFINYGIQHDFSMGYPTHPGFRAGTSNSFYFFDLDQNKITNLLIHPFSIMDIALQKYCDLKPKEALTVIKNIIINTKLVKGTFISIWHNESLSGYGNWIGWEFVYEEMLKFIADADD